MLIIVTIYDSKSVSYSSPTFLLARGDALRQFTDMANDTGNKVGLHPEDYSMFEIGTFDERTGELTVYEHREHIANATDLVQSDSEKPQKVA